MTTEQIFFYIVLGMIVLLYLRKQWNARGIAQYAPAEVQERMKSGSVLVDVRTARERSRQSIPSSIHIPLHEISSRIQELERHRGKEIICYCATGNRSVSAAVKLKKAGFTAGNLKGGIASWNFSHR